MMKIWFVAILVLGLMAFSTPVLTQEPGDLWTIGSYCLGDDPKYIGDFTDAIVRGGIEVFEAIMRDPSSPCFDTRIHVNIKPVRVFLVKKLWDFVLPSGEALAMWTMKDAKGRRGFMWITNESYIEVNPA